MKMDMDTIQFESRVEVGSILGALETYLESEKEKGDRDSYDDIIQEFVDKLDVMFRNW